MGSILDYFPYDTPRGCQRDTLLEVEREWENYDVFVIGAPTGSGKSGIGATIQSWRLANKEGAAYIVPQNVLRNQLLDDFDHMHTVKSQDEYWIEKYQMTEKEFRRKIYKFGPRGSEYEADRRKAKRKGTAIVSNYHTYIAHKLQRDILIADEAHSLLKTMQDMASRKIWRHIHGYPMLANTVSDILQWIESKGSPSGMLLKLKNEIRSLNDGTVIQMGQDYYRGSLCDCMKLLPIDVSNEKPVFWPSKTKKIVLMSATIGEEDIKNMGLSSRRVLYLDVESPIPAENRPVRLVPIADMSHRNQESSIPLLADAILRLASQNPEKGFVHATYDVSRKLRPYLEGDKRFMFHSTADDKMDVYDKFLESDPSEGKILIGSGLYEGVDMKYDIARWQVMTKAPYPSLMNPAMRYLARELPDSYLWMVTKDILQACGRVCRSETDYGITYLLDTSFKRWYNKAEPTLPKWFNMEEI